MSVSHSSVDTDMKGEDLVRSEAISNCKHKHMWSGFLCLFALSSVTDRTIVSYYPDFGVEKWKLLFNQTVEPPLPSVSKLHILFCYDGDVLCRDFHHNHYVPLIFGLLNASVKRKTLQSSKNQRKHASPLT